MREVSFVRPNCFASGRLALIVEFGGPAALVVYFALSHGTASHMTGLCHAPIGSLSRDTRLPPEVIEDALASLDSAGLIERDTANGLVLIHGEFARQVTRSGKGDKFDRKKAAAGYARCKEYAYSGLSASLRAVLDIASASGSSAPDTKECKQHKEAKGEGKGANTTYTVSDTLSDTVSNDSQPAVRRPRGPTSKTVAS